MNIRRAIASCASLFGWFVLSACLAVPGCAETPIQPAHPTAMVTETIDESILVTLHGSVHPLATPAADQGASPGSLQLGRTILVLKRNPLQQAALDKLANDQQNPKSPHYHKWLTPEQFGAQFGLASQDIEKITQWLESYGFQVEAQIAGRSLIIFSGTNAQLKAAFHTELHNYKIKSGTYYANANDPQIPAAIAPVVVGIASLNNFPRHAMHTKSQFVHHTESGWRKATGPSATNSQPEFTTTDQGMVLHLLAPYDLATIYNILPLWNAGIDGTGETIAIVSESDINPADVDYFRSTFGLPAKKLNLIYYGPNPGKTAEEDEADIDVQWSGAVATNATIDLVVAANTATSGGIDGAAAYIINNNLASIMSVSYGECELYLGTAGNQYYNQIWEQAASQGIAVMVASGDSGSDVCDDAAYYSSLGLSVSGISSTPYNVAVGGTDLYGTYVDTSKYWKATNDPNTLSSVISYVPESAWNNSCANPQILAALQANGSDTTDTTPEALCNDSAWYSQFLNTAGGSGGASNCATSTGSTAAFCVSGYPKPAWQSGVTGIPPDGVRDVPDVALMSGNGLWGSFYVYCNSDAEFYGVCDINTSLQGAGGTSFAAPIFAGMMALVQQKTASQQGNVNYVLYKLGKTQYSGSNAASCTSDTAVTGNSCMFYDVTDSNNAVPCLAGTTDCTPAMATDSFGVLPGFNAGPGYDLVAGLGSVNAYNLVENWSSATATFLPSTISIAATDPTTAVYGTPLSVTVSVAAVAPATGTPSGDAGITSDETVGTNTDAVVTLSGGRGVVGVTQLPGGSYSLFAHYAGDATFAPSLSSGLSVTIAQANATGVLNSTRRTVQPGQNVLFSVTMTSVPNGSSPTGTVMFTDTTTGVLLGSEALVSSPSSTSSAISIAFVTLPSAQLQLGENTITATYSGDSNYSAANVAPLMVSLSGSFTTTTNPSSLSLAPNTAGSVTVTATPNGSTVLNAGSLAFSCPSTMPIGLACSFSAPALSGQGSVSSTLTLQLAAPLYVGSTQGPSIHASQGGWFGAGATGSLAGVLLLVLPRRRRKYLLALTMLASGFVFFTIGCGGGKNQTPALIPTKTTLSASPAAPTLGNPVVLTASVAASSGMGQPTGRVTFTEGGTLLGTANLASGSASFTANSLPIGVQAITATYGGDSTYSGSSSSNQSLDVVFKGVIVITTSDSAGDQSSTNLTVSSK
jgi:multisubunit Na+/H+ antiporter MnhC subunit